jgi:hypothetical protein
VDLPRQYRSGSSPQLRRLVVVDEAWLLMRDGEGARFLFRMSKAARKRNAGLTVVTQDVADVLGTDLGHAVVANAATQILLKQAPQAIDAVGAAFGLTAGERRLLLAARTGQGLLLAGTNRTGFQAISSTAEHRLCTTDPGFDNSEGLDGFNSGPGTGSLPLLVLRFGGLERQQRATARIGRPSMRQRATQDERVPLAPKRVWRWHGSTVAVATACRTIPAAAAARCVMRAPLRRVRTLV